MSRSTVEFVIEPFAPGAPGPHVISGIEAMEAAGFDVSMGPFASRATGAASDMPDAIRKMLASAFEHGAHRVLVEVVIDGS